MCTPPTLPKVSLVEPLTKNISRISVEEVTAAALAPVLKKDPVLGKKWKDALATTVPLG